MTLLRNGLARALLFTFLICCAVLVFLNIYLSGKLRQLAPGYLERFSKLSGFNIQTDKASLDPLFRIRLDGVKAADPDPAKDVVAEIGTLIIDPGVISSLMSRRVTIREVVLDRPVVRYNRGSADRVLDLIRGDGSKGSSFEIKRLRLNDARIEIDPDTAFTSDALEIRILGKGARNESGITVEGDVAVFGNGMDVSGTVNLKPGETAGRIKIVADESRPGSSPDSLVSSRNLRGVSEITFRATDDIDSHGEISVFSLDNGSGAAGEAIGSLKYDLAYDGDTDTAHVKNLAFDVINVISGSLAGDVKDITGGRVFDLKGSLSSGDLTELSRRVPGIDPRTVTGLIRSDNLRIEGALGKNDVRLTGNVFLDGIGFSFADESLRVSGLGCDMDIKQSLSGGSGLSFTSRGRCSAAEFKQRDIGSVNDLTAGVDINIDGLWSRKELRFAGLNGRFMDGAASGSLRLSSADGKSEIAGSLNGSGLNLEKAPKSIAPFDMSGTAGSISAEVEGSPGDYRAGITFDVSDFTVRSKIGREFKVSRAKSAGPLDLEYLEGTLAAGAEVERKIVIKDKGLSYQGLSFGEYFIESGKVDDLSFSLDLGGDWTLGMASRGKGFKVLGMDVRLEEFQEHIEIADSGRRGFSGSIDGTGGSFKSVTFPALSAEYVFDGSSIDVRKLRAKVSSIGELVTDDFRVEFGTGKGGYPYVIKLDNGTFSGYEGKLKSEGISGSFVVNDPSAGKTSWEGKASAAKTDVFSQVVAGLKLTVTPSPDGIIINDVSGKFLNGDLKGRIDIVTSGQAAQLVTGLGLLNASVKSGGLDVALGRADFDFSGTLTDGSLPEGTGKLGFDNLNLRRQGLDARYSGAVSTRTSGETLFIDDGFIRNEDNSELRFSGEMINSPNGARRLALSFPDFALKSAVKFLSPAMPVTVEQARVAGTAGFKVEFNNLFNAGSSWSGSLSFNGASFAAYMGGAELSLRGINGTITAKNEGEGGNALASLLNGALTLDREVYKNYLRSFKESDPDGEADRIKIEQIEYGILKFENVECALVADRSKLGILKLAAGFFGGKLYANGVLNLGGSGGGYNFSFLFNDISLGAFSTRLSASEEYITGRANGLVWLTGEGGDLGTIDGPFEFWSVGSDKETRSIGKALLDKLGAKERLILGSSRSYDNGEISGYINDGVITFKKFVISNSFLGIKNLSIQADPVKNSISIAHLVSVIREIARRSQSGGPTIQTQ